MPILPERDAQRLREYLSQTLTDPVTIDLFIESKSLLVVPGREPCEFCAETRQLLEEVAALSDRITVAVHDIRGETALAAETGVTHAPSLVLQGAARGGVRYVGIPSGYEFMTLLEDLIAVSRGTTGLRSETRQALRELSKNVHIQVFVTPTCPYCPPVARLAHQMAVESARITADVVEVSEFPELAARYGVHGVPKVVINDAVEFVGAQPEAAFLDAVLRAAAA